MLENLIYIYLENLCTMVLELYQQFDRHSERIHTITQHSTLLLSDCSHLMEYIIIHFFYLRADNRMFIYAPYL